MNVSTQLIGLLKDYESFRERPYAASEAEKKRGIWTIGYGMTTWPNGRRVTAFDAPISEVAATNYLKDKLAKYEAMANSVITVKLKQNEFDAVVMWMYNCVGSAVKAAGTDLIKLLNAGDKEGAAKEFDKWVYQNHVKLPGLVARREDETEVFLFAEYQRGNKSSKGIPKTSAKS